MSIQLPAQLQPIASNAGPWSRPWYEWAWRVTDAVNAGGGGGGGAPTNATYVTLSTDATLTAERVLTAGAGISITDGGAGGPVTIAATGGGAPTNAQYVTLATDAGLSAERVLTAGAGITITDGGANNPVTVAASSKGVTAYVNFGSTPNTRLTATVVDAAVTPASIVLPGWGAVLNTDDNDPEMDDITFNAVPAAGSFTLVASCQNEFLGRCRVNYTVF